MKKLRSNIFSNISHPLTYHPFSLFTILISLFTLLILSCTDSTEPKTATLTGTISLINDSNNSDNDPIDFSDITVALFELAELDTTIVRINNQYPQIGVHITQHTEFDHRFQSPIATTTTNAEGSFSLESSPGTYNLVALKDGWGWRYIYEISLSDGDNELADVMEQSRLNYRTVEQRRNFVSEKLEVKREKGISSLTSHLSPRNADISLYSVTTLSGYVDTEVTIPPFHHLICTDNVTFAPGSHFELQPNSVCRIAGGESIDIHGTVKMLGEDDGMFTVTSNEGYDEFPTAIDSLSSDEMIRKIEIGQTAQIDSDEIKWGSFSWLNNGISNSTDMSFKNNILRNGNNAFVNNKNLNNFSNSFINKFGQLGLITYMEVLFDKNIMYENYDACRISECNGIAGNNYFIKNEMGIRPHLSEMIIKNNNFEKNNYAIVVCAAKPSIEYNDFILNNKRDIELNSDFISTNQGYDFSYPSIMNNNFWDTEIVLSNSGVHDLGWGATGQEKLGLVEDLYLQNNYWNNQIIDERIYISELFDIQVTIFTDPSLSAIDISGIDIR